MAETGTRYVRAIFATDLEAATDPVSGPERRFHHSGQRALNLSETIEGVVVAMQTYLSEADPERVIVPLKLTAGTVLDARNADTHLALRTNPGSARVRWQEDRAAGRRPASWDLSDAAREAGADAMLYTSRKRPDLTRLVLFRWNRPGSARLVRAGAPLPFAH